MTYRAHVRVISGPHSGTAGWCDGDDIGQAYVFVRFPGDSRRGVYVQRHHIAIFGIDRIDDDPPEVERVKSRLIDSLKTVVPMVGADLVDAAMRVMAAEIEIEDTAHLVGG